MVPPSVVPPAGSVKMPSVSASSRIALDDLHRRSPPCPCRRSRARSAAPGSRRPDCRSRSTSRSCSAGPVPGDRAPAVERVHDRRAAGRLRGVNARQLAFDEPDRRAARGSRARCAAAACRRRPARRRAVGKSPAELLGDLESERLRALGVVRPQVDVHESPAEPIRHLRAQPVHIVVVAGDRENRRTEDRRPEHLARLEVVGDEHAALQPETRGVRRHAVGEVARRRAGEHVEPELRRARVAATDTTRSL